MNIRFSHILLIIFFFTYNCSSNNKKAEDDKGYIETDARIRAEKAREKGGGLMGIIEGNKAQNTVNFATTNVLWKATLKTLDFLPLITSDYSGGILAFDWYSENLNSDEQIKITVKFLSNELRSESIEIVSHKKVCGKINEKCTTSLLSNNFSNEIKVKIITTARLIKIEETKNKK